MVTTAVRAGYLTIEQNNHEHECSSVNLGCSGGCSGGWIVGDDDPQGEQL